MARALSRAIVFCRNIFLFRKRFFMFEVGGRKDCRRRSARGAETQLDLILLLNSVDLNLENGIEPENFALHCAPAVNLFPAAAADRIHISEKLSEFQIIPDRTRPLDFEVYNVQKVVGIGAGNEQVQEFSPFYRARDAEDGGAYYTLSRVPRVASAKEQRFGARTRYPGSESYLSLVDARNAPFRTDLKQLAVSVYCTNRDLPLTVPVGRGETDFTMEAGAPVAAIRSITGQPTPPRPSYAESDTAWRIISHLSLNYLSLTDALPETAAAAGGVNKARNRASRSAATLCRPARNAHAGQAQVCIRRFRGILRHQAPGRRRQEYFDQAGDPPHQ